MTWCLIGRMPENCRQNLCTRARGKKENVGERTMAICSTDPGNSGWWRVVGVVGARSCRCGRCGVGGQSCNKTETLDWQKFLILAFFFSFYYSPLFPDFLFESFCWAWMRVLVGGWWVLCHPLANNTLVVFAVSSTPLRTGTACGKTFQ